MSVLATITATRIKKPLEWWPKNLPLSIKGFLVKLWPWTLIAFVLVFIVGVVIGIFGYPLLWFFDEKATNNIVWTLAYIMVGLMLVSIITAFAYDINEDDSTRVQST